MAAKRNIAFAVCFLIMLLICACGQDRRVETIGDTNLTLEQLNNDVATGADAFYDGIYDVASAGNAIGTDGSPDNVNNTNFKTDSVPYFSSCNIFKYGVWAATRDYVFCEYWVFHNDGTMSLIDCGNGETRLFTPGIDDEPERFDGAMYEQIDEDHIVLSYADGTRADMRRISKKTGDITIYSDSRIINSIRSRYGISCIVAGWDYRTVTLEFENDGTVIVVDRLSGEVDQGSGRRIYID